MGWSYTHGVAIKNQEGYLGCGGPPEQQGNPSPTLGSQAWNTSAGKRSPYNIWLWKAVGFVSKKDNRLLDTQGLQVLKRPCTNSLSALAQEQQLEKHEGHKGRNWIASEQGLESQGAEQLSPGWDVLASAMIPLLTPSSTQSAKYKCSINLLNTICPALVIPWDPTQPNLGT